jgi:hypothetical protein
MCESIMGVALGISSQATADADSELTTGLTTISGVVTYLALQEAFSKLLSTDAENIYIANMNVPGNPSGTVGVAIATQQRSIDSTQSDMETGKVNTIIQGQKGAAQAGANAMSGVFDLENPITDLLRDETEALQQILG